MHWFRFEVSTVPSKENVVKLTGEFNAIDFSTFTPLSITLIEDFRNNPKAESSDGRNEL